MEYVRYAFIAAGVGAIAYSLIFLLRFVRPGEGVEQAERMQDVVRFSVLGAAGLTALILGVYVEF